MGGYFIALEGLDGAGKTLQAAMLSRKVASLGLGVLSTAEPTDGPVGKLIKEMLVAGQADPRELALLFTADRYQHLRVEVEPALSKGAVVITDRYFYSTLAYEGAMGVDLDYLRQVNRLARLPDLAVLIDVPVEVALSRISSRRALQLTERGQLLSSVNGIYREMASRGELAVVDGRGKPEEVFDRLWGLVGSLLEFKKP
ncbi:MAG: dTMP kinase [Thermoprotei archaeon]|nr:dTMP kinase [TACK group archaeon]